MKRTVAGRALHGLRLLDYAHSHSSKFLSLPRASYLLQARVGQRYRNEAEDPLEIATILVHSFGLMPTERSPEISRRLKLDIEQEKLLYLQGRLDSAVARYLRRGRPGYTAADVEQWVRCFRASSMSEALEVMDGCTDWPYFLLVYTLHRRCTNPLEAYNAIRVVQHVFTHQQVNEQYETELAVLALQLAQAYLIDLCPVVARMWVEQARHKQPRVYNELLWVLAKIGTSWPPRQLYLLRLAQLVLTRDAPPGAIDHKGTVAVAYLGHFDRPHLSLRLVEPLPSIPGSEIADFPYKSGKLAIELLCAESAADALGQMESLDSGHRTPFMWALMILGLRNKKLLDSELAWRLWHVLVYSRKRSLNGLGAELLLHAVPDWGRKRHMLVHLNRIQGLRVTPRIRRALVPRSSAEELQEFVRSEYWHPEVSEALLEAQSILEPSNVWETYLQVTKNASVSPSTNALRGLCRAAWNPSLKWGEMWAPQRALAEVRMWVRGAQAPANDVLRVYPDEPLLTAYVIMCGRAGYNGELARFLEWMDRLDYRPSKRLLLALIHASPQGPALLRLGAKAREAGGSSEWPTEEELRLYELERDTGLKES